ncbi:hypothetical protein BDW62DRAFT_166889 [Aspergillus aurantiobrunneus]
MHFSSSLLALIPALPFSLAAPTEVAAEEAPPAPPPAPAPVLPDGVPNPSPEQLQRIEHASHGTMPGLPLSANVSSVGVTNLQLLAFYEYVEVAFFHELLGNVTNSEPGYEFDSDDDYDFVVKSLSAIVAQAQIHALTANDALTHYGVKSVEPCRYTFPVSTFEEAVALATSFTANSLATLQDITERFAANGDVALVRVMAGIIGNKGTQQGWLRVYQNKYPSEVPILTTSDVDFAFAWAQTFTVPTTCPSIADIKLRTFAPLEIVTPAEPRTHKVQIAWNHGAEDNKDKLLWLAYINQQNAPIVVPIQVVVCEDTKSIAEAVIPYDEFLLNGLTVAAVVNRRGPFANAAAVAQATVYGPALFIVQ